MSKNPGPEKIVLVLQGGGALGAYQGGVYGELLAAGLNPKWIAGISIGAINAAIIAGNRPENRVVQLRRFWDLVSSNLTGQPIGSDDVSRKMFNETSAALAISTGIPGFFSPRFPPSVLMPAGTPQAISFYDTSALRETLLELVDFDLLNSGSVRLSVGAVQVRTGNMKYFDTASMRIEPDHIMASGALPPGFPPVLIDGEAYWDGGLVSNTPLQYVLDGPTPRSDMIVFQIDLFNASGPLPGTLLDVGQREKEIRFSSRTRLNTDMAAELQRLRRAVEALAPLITDDIRASTEWQSLEEKSCGASITIVHLIHRRATYWSQSTDYEFSRFSIDEHWDAGRRDVEKTLAHPAWQQREGSASGVNVLDLTRDSAQKSSTGHTS